ncbi:tRNA glutamyl-Q(34) synthetase GluQRS [Brucella melitensis]|uniref:Glutamyl-tRNA synthetase n=1 Tax=Brucella melitensis biotype 1 (strain ATCC 23456 / CCUG 17765 / NCTC 10094 / 16M) TaxID=224914 RepID=Q8YIR2_BRUME|nr:MULTISPECIES: tRNA glutamyl-Q(34) synthetase GluQRS [Brucella]AAL51562.1 glutamyl-tRNA synthetase [Brucella melitensis bv. 1 str. 16M]AIJ89819.1 tRNA synthetases class I (E and Q), catalytic domain protein [Brucella melitensis bv. 1 str. 16M]ARY44107.1 tRNA glutamyl-Q(34) synthetase GluQRS [Brucella melitensis]ARY47268.1 tRNA glutamyl-Q(34) synthetase GluQRS [Brucella melitensis]AVM30617.1 tRNA glutamyl-Q(34) synthetase GluQRS [Brucella melitensis]
MTVPVFRFAPSPNGQLHLGHAYSALLNANMAEQSGGRFLLRMEDIDTARCTPALEQGIYDDLHWLGLRWETPVRRQSEHFGEYRNALTKLADKGLVYPAFLSRSEVRKRISEACARGDDWPSDPDGTPLYPQDERNMSEKEQMEHIVSGAPYAWRLDMDKALASAGEPLFWNESGAGPDGETGRLAADPARWGDVVIARKDTPTSYHLSVVVDDALQGITHIVRGRDLFHATSVHRLLQKLLGLPEPLYHHHDLVLGEDGQKLSKSRKDTALASLLEQGWTPADIRAKLGL